VRPEQTSTQPRATVVIPTRDRPAALRRCLAAVAAQRADIPSLEIVVVDDGSRDAGAVAAAVEAADARLVRTGPLGVSAARNRGAREARAPLLCFTDDDCEPLPGWARRLVERLEDVTAAAGPTVNGRPEDPLATAVQIVSNAFLPSAALGPATTPFAPASNLACHASVAAEIPFDDAFSPVGAEERDWYRRATDAGHAVAFVPDACVLHHPALSIASFWRKNVRYGRGSYAFHRRHSVGPEPVSFYANLVRKGFEAGPRAGACVVVAQLATATGVVQQALRS
jgi:glycosyltransferase involved in cell wall biosynthesis